eukprot:SM000171S03244  [mRNA]  locus=s171:301062:307446:+ [translate_table: standard]
MARSKESLVVLVDVGPSMHTFFEDTKHAVTSLFQQKLLFHQRDEVAIVAFGNDTQNELFDETGGDYEHVAVIRGLDLVSLEAFNSISSLKLGKASADHLDALFVAVDLMVKKLGEVRKGNKQIVLITTGDSPVTSPEHLEILGEQLVKQGIKLDVVMLRSMKTSTVSKIAGQNEQHLKKLVSDVHGKLKIVYDGLPLLAATQPKVAPSSTFRGDFEITPSLTIKVFVYKKTYAAKFPFLHRYSDKAPADDPAATRAVQGSKEYRSTTNSDVTVPPDQITKGFRYGPQLVPISATEEAQLRFKADKGVRLIGFTEAHNVPRHNFLKDVNVFLPEAGNEKATVAISALARALAAAKKVAIVRCVFRIGARVVVGVLSPNLAEDDFTPDCFHFNVLPFAEDIREFAFSSFDEKRKPTSEQLEIARSLVRKLDLGPSPVKEESYKPEDTVNPAIQHFCTTVHKRALKPEIELPPVDEKLKQLLTPKKDLIESPAMQKFKQHFQLTHLDKKGKAEPRKTWGEKVAVTEAEEKADDARSAAMDESAVTDGPISPQKLTSREVDEVGSVTPVEDFQGLLARREGDKWVDTAVAGMEKVIEHMLDTAHGGNTFAKALDCLVAIREGCVMHEEPLKYNGFLRRLEEKCRNPQLSAFWQQIKDRKITFISKDESPDRHTNVQHAEESGIPRIILHLPEEQSPSMCRRAIILHVGEAWQVMQCRLSHGLAVRPANALVVQASQFGLQQQQLHVQPLDSPAVRLQQAPHSRAQIDKVAGSKVLLLKY